MHVVTANHLEQLVIIAMAKTLLMLDLQLASPLAWPLTLPPDPGL